MGQAFQTCAGFIPAGDLLYLVSIILSNVRVANHLFNSYLVVSFWKG